jgi:hypothetical protein
MLEKEECTMFDHILALLKLGTSIGTSIVKREKAPVAVAPSASSAVFDGRDLAIIFLSIALIFSTLAFFTLAASAATRR